MIEECVYSEITMKDDSDHVGPMSLKQLSQLSQYASAAMNAMAQYHWIMERHLNPKRLDIQGDVKKAIEDFNRLVTDKSYFISTAIFLNSVEFERQGISAESFIDKTRIDMTKAELSRKLLGNLDKTISPDEHLKNKRRIERVAQAGLDFGLYKIRCYPGCGNKKPLVTTPLLNAIMKSTHGNMNIAKDFINKYPPIVNYPIKDGTYA